MLDDLIKKLEKMRETYGNVEVKALVSNGEFDPYGTLHEIGEINYDDFNKLIEIGIESWG